MVQQLQIITDVFKQVAPHYKKSCAVDDLTWAVEKNFLMSIIKSSKQLKLCTVDSLQTSALQAASTGLSLNPMLAHIYLIPRRMRKRQQGESDIEYTKVPYFSYASPSYKGLSYLATKTGSVRYIRSEVIFNDDVFEFYGPAEKPKFIANSIKSGKREEKDCIGVYAIARLKDGDYLTEFLDKKTILKIKNMSENPTGIMWNAQKLWGEGFRKAAIRRLAKTLPGQCDLIHKAIDVLNQHEGIIQSSENDIPAESIQVLSDNEALTLYAKLVDHNIESKDIERWLLKLSTRMGVANYTDIPADKFKEACNIIDGALTKIQTK